MCLCGDWDPKQADRKIANRNYKIRTTNAGPRGPDVWGGDMMGGPPRIGLPPGLAAGLGLTGGQPRPKPGSAFELPQRSRSNAGGGSRRGSDIGSGSRRPESRHRDGSRRASGRQSSMYGGSTRAAPDPVVPGPFNRRGGPPPSGGRVWMHGALGGSRASEGRDRSRSSREPPSRSQAAAMQTIRGPMPPGMRMVDRSGSRRSSRSGL